jgi:hypothetical protein
MASPQYSTHGHLKGYAMNQSTSQPLVHRIPKQRFLPLLVPIALAACAASPSRPVLYPNEHMREVGQQQAKRDLAQCESMARTAGATSSDKSGKVAKETAAGAGIGAASGAVGGAISGAAGSGAAIGAAAGATAALLHGLFSSPPPNTAYVEFVNRCLSERGYEITGWR